MSALNVEMVPLDQIDDNPEYNARSSLGDLTDLVQSITAHGVKQPITVKKHRRRDGWRLIAGFRRTAAAREAGLGKIPVIIEPQKTSAVQMALINVTENVQREELAPLDEAAAYADLIKKGLSMADLCKEMGKSRPYIEKRLALLQLSDVIREALTEKRIGVTAAVEIGRLPEDLHGKFVVVAEEFAVTKLRDKVNKELAKIEARAQPQIPTPDNVAAESARKRHEALVEEVQLEIGDMCHRYAPDQLPHIYALDISLLEEPSLRILLNILQGCRKSLHPDEDVYEVDFSDPSANEPDDDSGEGSEGSDDLDDAGLDGDGEDTSSEE